MGVPRNPPKLPSHCQPLPVRPLMGADVMRVAERLMRTARADWCSTVSEATKAAVRVKQRRIITSPGASRRGGEKNGLCEAEKGPHTPPGGRATPHPNLFVPGTCQKVRMVVVKVS